MNRLVDIAHDAGAAAEGDFLAHGEVGATSVTEGRKTREFKSRKRDKAKNVHGGVLLDEIGHGHTVLGGNGGADIARLDSVGA